MGDGFRKFLEERGEYPFKDDDPHGKLRFGRILRIRTETLLVVALAFLIANIASFSLGVWNGKRGTAVAGEPGEPLPVAQKLGDVAPPNVIADPVPPAARRAASTPTPRPPQEPAAPAPAVQDAKYTIRVASLGLSQNKEAAEIAAFFAQRGYNPSVARKAGSCLVIEVGGFASSRGPDAVRALKDVQNAKFKFTRFKDAFFVRK